jgi:hypothetical protein
MKSFRPCFLRNLSEINGNVSWGVPPQVPESQNSSAFDYVFDKYIEVMLACGTKYIKVLIDCVNFKLRRQGDQCK